MEERSAASSPVTTIKPHSVGVAAYTKTIGKQLADYRKSVDRLHTEDSRLDLDDQPPVHGVDRQEVETSVADRDPAADDRQAFLDEGRVVWDPVFEMPLESDMRPLDRPGPYLRATPLPPVSSRCGESTRHIPSSATVLPGQCG